MYIFRKGLSSCHSSIKVRFVQYTTDCCPMDTLSHFSCRSLKVVAWLWHGGGARLVLGHQRTWRITCQVDPPPSAPCPFLTTCNLLLLFFCIPGLNCCCRQAARNSLSEPTSSVCPGTVMPQSGLTLQKICLCSAADLLHHFDYTHSIAFLSLFLLCILNFWFYSCKFAPLRTLMSDVNGIKLKFSYRCVHLCRLLQHNGLNLPNRLCICCWCDQCCSAVGNLQHILIIMKHCESELFLVLLNPRRNPDTESWWLQLIRTTQYVFGCAWP